MTQQIRKMLSLILALALLVVVFVPSFAEEAEVAAEEVIAAEESVPAEEEAEEEVEEEDDEDLVEIDDGDLVEFDDDEWGYADSELIAEHTPAMTEEFIFADDPDHWAEKEAEASQTAETAPAAEETETAEETAPVTSEEVPAAEATAEPAAEEADVATAEEAKETNEEAIQVTVEAVMVGENEMKLTATVNGNVESNLAFQWQVSDDAGEHYEDIENATGNELLVELTEEDIDNLWRVRVDIA